MQLILSIIVAFWSWNAFGLDCPLPQFVRPEAQPSIHVQSPTALFVTHSSGYFDPLKLTQIGMQTSVRFAKASDWSVFYLHDAANSSNPFSQYLYDDCSPDAYLYSDIGFYSVDISKVEHVLVAGGYYELCENDTVKSTIEMWSRLTGEHHLTITQITDAVFGVGEDMRFEDPYYDEYQRHFQVLRARHPKSAIALDEILELTGSTALAVDYLQRRLPATMPGWNVAIEYEGQTKHLVQNPSHRSSLTFQFKRSDQL